MKKDILRFFQGKKVLITGDTGFKGSWLCYILQMSGANVMGYSIDVPTSPSLYNILEMHKYVKSAMGDIRDYGKLLAVVSSFRPEIVFHLAAQPIVRTSYKNPRETYETNVIGTVNICECVRMVEGIRSFINITTDKVYLNREWDRGYVETDHLDGFDPYSNSKSCSELVTHSYNNSFFKDMGIAVSTARAGNVIGGGDFANDRIIPDCVRAVSNRESIIVRNPHSTRPYQHVLEPLFAYLMVAKEQYENLDKSGYYNIGPDDKDCVTTGELATIFCDAWGDGASWKVEGDGGPHEANFLKLDSSKLKETFDWEPRWSVIEAVEKSVEWYKAWSENKSGDYLRELMKRQIEVYFMDKILLH